MQSNDLQGILDRSIVRLRNMKQPAAIVDKPKRVYHCYYRRPDDAPSDLPRACLVGEEIPDAYYNPKMERIRARDLSNICYELGWDVRTSYFLDKLQKIHDSRLLWNASGFKGWDKLKELAQEYNLKFDPNVQVPV